jgi:hypothetical protein
MRTVVHADAEPTIKQLDFVKRLGGDRERAEGMTRKGVSAYIQTLMDARKRSAAPPVAYAHAYTGAGDDVSPPPAPKEHPTDVPTLLLQMVPDGRYALQLDSAHKWVFFRVSRPDSRGFPKGTLKVQTQHGPTLSLCYVVWPEGNISWYERQYMEELKLLLVTWARAGIDYGRKKRKCCLCGLALTDPTSRKYCVGTDCITTPRGQSVVAEVDRLIELGLIPAEVVEDS